jgi:ribosomal-protein-alanine N-acetyltransferase
MLAIRPGRLDDLDRVVAIERLSFSDPWTADTFVSVLALTHIRFLVAEDVGAPEREGGGAPDLVGYVVALVMADEGEVADLAVAPAARRRGVARLLLDRVASEASEMGIRALYLEVRESNSAARTLYESSGFVAVGRRRAYYRRPVEDALLLRRELAPT